MLKGENGGKKCSVDVTMYSSYTENMGRILVELNEVQHRRLLAMLQKQIDECDGPAPEIMELCLLRQQIELRVYRRDRSLLQSEGDDNAE